MNVTKASRSRNRQVTMVDEYEVSEILGISCHTLRRWRYNNLGLPFYKIGKCVRYKMEDVERFIEENRQVVIHEGEIIR